jgi:hypothetical protein
MPGGERCWCVPDGAGGTMRIRARRRPTGKTLRMLQNLFRAARAGFTLAGENGRSKQQRRFYE